MKASPTVIEQEVTIVKKVNAFNILMTDDELHQLSEHVSAYQQQRHPSNSWKPTTTLVEFCQYLLRETTGAGVKAGVCPSSTLDKPHPPSSKGYTPIRLRRQYSAEYKLDAIYAYKCCTTTAERLAFHDKYVDRDTVYRFMKQQKQGVLK